MTVDLFTPLKLGDLTLPNRIIMAPMTRGRAMADGTPTDIMATYYTQRASAGLIITEATAISKQGSGWKNAPAIYHDAHIAGWKKTTNAVHEAGGRIFLQLWHMGRVSHPDFQNNSHPPVGPSAIKVDGVSRSIDKPYVTPKTLEVDEIKHIVSDYSIAAKRAIEAGFDGVEIHAANGYLIEQFLCSGSNKRDDDYGGSLENRLRFLSEVSESVIHAIGKDKVGVRLSPNTPLNGMQDDDPEKTYVAAAKLLNDLSVAYMHIYEPITHDATDRFSHDKPKLLPHMRKAFTGTIIANGRYTKELAQEALSHNRSDAVAFGRPFIANPNLPQKLKDNLPLSEADPSIFYSDGEKGYIDY